MATVQEMMMDAAASVETAAMMSAGDTFEGSLSSKSDEDWIRIELTAGMLYTISLSGAAGGVSDTVLKLLDSKGGLIDSNDDIDGAKGNLNSELMFTPEVSGTYYISAGAYTGNPSVDNMGAYTVTVTEMVVDPTMGAAIVGTDRVEADPNEDPPVEYVSGNDKLSGTSAGEMIMGLGGDDSLYGGGGDDTLDGGAGDDLLVGGAGADTLMGGMGDGDTISYGYSPAGVTINLDDGTARGGNADGDTIVDMGEDRVENVIGSEHDDAITGNRYANSLWGRGGNDELDGLRGNDMLFGGSGDDDLDGGRGDDTLEGGYGADVLTGGDGMNTASYAGSMMGVTVRLHNSKAMGGDAEGDTFAGRVTATYTNEDDEEIEVSLPDIANLTGSANADVLAGDFRDNEISGGGGDDKIYGGPGGGADSTNADTLSGDGGDDMIFGGAGDDELDGGAGNDMLVGGAGNDMLVGGAGSDMIYADAMDTVINGFMVNDPDTADVDESDESVNNAMDVDTLSYAMVDNENETGITAALADTITNIENIVGSKYDDVLTGDDQNNVIEGGRGRDDLDGGDGMDTLSYENSDDWVRVTLNNTGDATASRGHARGDMAENFENIMGSAYDDDLTGNDAANVLMGGDGDDEIVGSDGADTVEGGAGADELDGDHGNRPDGGGADQQERDAADVLSYAGSDAGVTVNLATASASGGHAEGDTIVTFEVETQVEVDGETETIETDVSTFEYVTGSMHDDRLTGDDRANHLVGGGGGDTLRGGAGADLVIGGPGADMLDGGEDEDEKDNMIPDPDDDDPTNGTDMIAASEDWAVYKSAKEGIMVDLSTNMGTGGDAMGDTLVNIELVWGSEHADTFIASNGADIIEGDGGSDTVSYMASEMGVTVDLSSDTQHRTVVATGTGTEDDPFVFGPDADPAAVDQPTTGVPAILEDTTADESEDNPNTNGARGDKLGSIENITGTDHADNLTGDENPNTLRGNGGNDMIDGGSGDDPLLYGGPGEDTIMGGIGNDKLVGCTGDDKLDGGAGADMLIGLAGDDDLTGGAGNDTFVFSTADSGDSDAILDYADGDQIDLSAFDITAEQLLGAITLRGAGQEAYVVVNLTDFGGGRITMANVSDLDTLDTEATDNDMIDTLSVGDDGIFII